MKDIAEHKGIVTDTDRLERELGVKVIETSARKGINIDQLKKLLKKGLGPTFIVIIHPT